MSAKMRKFMKTHIWRVGSAELPRARSKWIRLLRVFVVSLHGFRADQCVLRASALTFYSLLSIGPILAAIFGLAKGVGFEKTLERQIFERFQGQEQVLLQITEFAHSLLENVRGGLIAGVAVLLLLWTIIRVCGNIEDSFNHIWGIKKPRAFTRKITDYVSAMVICPLLFIVSSAATVVIKSHVMLVGQKIAPAGVISPVIFFTLSLLPYCVLWVLFSFVYVFMPNGKVKFRSAVFAGIVASVLYQLFQGMYLSFQIVMAKHNPIYGSFAALPLFLVWLQLSWMIMLFGAELSFAHQNEETYEFDPEGLNVSYAFRRLLTLGVVHLVVKESSPGHKPMSAAAIANTMVIPVRLVREMLDELVRCGIISETCDSETGQGCYQPAQDVGLFTIKYVVDALEQCGRNDIPVASSNELDRISKCLKGFGDLIEKSPDNVLLKDI